MFRDSTPLFFGLAPHRRRRRVLDLDPLLRSAGAVRRTNPLRDNTFTTELAGLLIDDFTVAA